MTDSWASHPSGPLSERVASFLSRGWKVEAINTGGAVMVRRRRWTRPARLMWNPFYLFYFFRKDRWERVRLTITTDDHVLERALPSRESLT
jgi:hypothetical protein